MSESSLSLIEVIDKEDGRGRGLYATEDLSVGTTIMIEEPLAVAVFPHHNRCERCVKWSQTPYFCKYCKDVSYCSESCRDAYWNSIHQYLCTETKNCTADRKEGIQYFRSKFLENGKAYPWLVLCLSVKAIGEMLDRGEAVEEEQCWAQELEREGSVWHQLVSLFSYEMEEGLAERALQARPEVGLYVEILQSLAPNGVAIASSEVYCWLLSVLVSNCFGIWTDTPEDDSNIESTNRREDAVGVYCKAALFNHSCSPNMSRCYEHGTFELTFVVKDKIDKGEELNIEYIDTRGSLPERIALLAPFRFLCECTRCIEESNSRKSDNKE